MAGIKTRAACLEYGYSITWKERQTKGSLFEKTLSLKSEKYRSAKKIGYLSKYYDDDDL